MTEAWQKFPDSPELLELREQALLAARTLPVELDDIWGHVTCRLPEEFGGGFLLKHLRIPARGIDPDEVMVYDEDGRRLFGTQRDPWEIPLYTATYRHRPDVQSVIHTHPPVATAIASAGRTIHAIGHEGLEFGDGLPVFQGDIIDTDDLGEGMARALGSAPACLLKGHGAVVVGESIPHAAVSSLYLERTAKQLVAAATVGQPEVLPKHIGDHIVERRRGEKAPLLWRYLEWRATGR